MNTVIIEEPFVLENKYKIEGLRIAFRTFGHLNEKKDNVIWVCHALTANSDVLNWWPGLFGNNQLFDPKDHFIVCPNVPGSCYGSSGPVNTQNNGIPLLNDFPELTTRDMAKAHELLRKYLGIKRIRLLIGASLGGQQALEWAILQPGIFTELVLIATNARHSAYGIAFNESQRWAIESDPTFGKGNRDGGKTGLAIARSIAMISYRSYRGYTETQSQDNDKSPDQFRAASYQRYQGNKLAQRFCAYSYVTLSRAMDSHNVGRGRESTGTALAGIKARTLCIGISSDVLFPTVEQQYLAKSIKGAEYFEIDSLYGHDGFLIETQQLTRVISDFMHNQFRTYRRTTLKNNSISINYQSN